MEDMHKHGVKLAVLIFEFRWAEHGKQLSNWTSVGGQYFRDYDGSFLITDPKELTSIRATGLEEQLGTEALLRAKRAHWFELPHSRRGLGYKEVWLADNEWLPVVPPADWLGQYPGGTTPLMHAAMLGDVPWVERLLNQGADVNAVDSSGSTALNWAAATGGPAAVQALLNAGAAARGESGGRSLTAAAAGGNARSVEILLKAGADPNFRDKDGATPLSVATRHHFTEIVHLLKQAGAHE
jgi:hypothetical protein